MAEENDTSIAKVSQIHSLTADFLKKRLTENGFDDFASSHGYILYQLSVNPQITMKELAQKINRDKSTTTVLVRKLEAAGLVKITVDPGDKRNKLLCLTTKGSKYTAGPGPGRRCRRPRSPGRHPTARCRSPA